MIKTKYLFIVFTICIAGCALNEPPYTITEDGKYIYPVQEKSIPTKVIAYQDVVTEAGDDVKLGIVEFTPPVYPADALAEGVTGWVEVAFKINNKGKALEARIKDSNPAGVFDQAVLAALKYWRFELKDYYDTYILYIEFAP
ncbi:MAG: TonB family protein [Candidatus Omnitrophica bacterium]|nr:TonB family protein [Candidatus Omnitrophota bacterium]